MIKTSRNSYISFLRMRYRLAPIAGLALLLAFTVAHASAQSQGLVEREIRYHSAEAGEVALVWGVDGWQVLPATMRPEGTTVLETKSKVMQTPMVYQGGIYTTKVRVPAGARIDYIFHITKTRSGIATDAWDMSDQPEREFHIMAYQDGVSTDEATVALAQEIYSSVSEGELQIFGAIGLLALSILLAILSFRMHFRNPYLDF